MPATCPMKFNKLDFVRHVAGTKYPPNYKSISSHEGTCHCDISLGHVPATFSCTVVCANVVILSLLHVPATRPCYMSPQCVLDKLFVAATCRCDTSLQHDHLCLITLRPALNLKNCVRHFFRETNRNCNLFNHAQCWL